MTIANTTSPQSVTVQSQRKVHSLLASLQASLDATPLPHSVCQQSTGLTYSYLHALNNPHLKNSTDQLFHHLMRMLCVLACVIDEQALPAQLTANLSLGSTAVSSATSGNSQANITNANISPNVSTNESNSPKSVPNDTVASSRRGTVSSIRDTPSANKSMSAQATNSATVSLLD